MVAGADSSPKKMSSVVMPRQRSSVRPSRIPVPTQSPRRSPSSTNDQNAAEFSEDGTEHAASPTLSNSEIMAYQGILSNQLEAHQETARLDAAPAPSTIFDPTSLSFSQEIPSKQSFTHQEPPTNPLKPRRSILDLFPKRDKNQTPNPISPPKKSFLGATKDSLARVIRGGSKPQSNSPAVTAAVDERPGQVGTENRQEGEIFQCLLRAAECYKQASISAKHTEALAKDAGQSAEAARMEVVKIAELARLVGIEDETVTRLYEMIWAADEAARLG
ncbi:hypothetical protein Ptr902_07187 [Pyrenophora tritici-repentis]|nr:hypothetical protein Ptr902_07187 [Pyrenophora tritici-repentis]